MSRASRARARRRSRPRCSPPCPRTTASAAVRRSASSRCRSPTGRTTRCARRHSTAPARSRCGTLVKFVLAMRPDRIVVGEVRGAEAFELTRAINAGCGFMCTVHANSATEALNALVNAALMAGENVTERVVRKVFSQVARRRRARRSRRRAAARRRRRPAAGDRDHRRGADARRRADLRADVRPCARWARRWSGPARSRRGSRRDVDRALPRWTLASAICSSRRRIGRMTLLAALVGRCLPVALVVGGADRCTRARSRRAASRARGAGGRRASSGCSRPGVGLSPRAVLGGVALAGRGGVRRRWPALTGSRVRRASSPPSRWPRFRPRTSAGAARARLREVQAAWPDGLRDLVASIAAGRSLTQAVNALAATGPAPLRDAFVAVPASQPDARDGSCARARQGGPRRPDERPGARGPDPRPASAAADRPRRSSTISSSRRRRDLKVLDEIETEGLEMQINAARGDGPAVARPGRADRASAGPSATSTGRPVASWWS